MMNLKKITTRSIKTLAIAAPGFKTPPNSVTVIGYHRVVRDIEKAETDSILGLVVSTDTFREHCRILKENFDVISLEEAIYFLQKGSISIRPKAVITFDDGYLDNYEEAYPILRELNLPATIFLPTTLIGTEMILPHDKAFWLAKTAIERDFPLEDVFRQAKLEPETAHAFARIKDVLQLTDKIVYLPADLRDGIIEELEKALEIKEYPSEYSVMNWEMIREMRANNISFGVHSATHPVLPLENETAFEEEVFESKRVMEKELGGEVVSFAYPNGKYNKQVREQIIKAGYKIAVTTERRTNKIGVDLFSLGRICLCEESTRGIFGKFSPQITKLRFGIRPPLNLLFFLTQQPVEQFWGFCSIMLNFNNLL